eukprot:3204556-Alexandrium_andersonii.AAC.1
MGLAWLTRGAPSAPLGAKATCQRRRPWGHRPDCSSKAQRSLNLSRAAPGSKGSSLPAHPSGPEALPTLCLMASLSSKTEMRGGRS